MSISAAAAFGLSNCLRGRGLIPGDRWWCVALWMLVAGSEAAEVGYSAAAQDFVAVIVFAAGYLLLAPAHGAIFAAFNGHAIFGGVPSWIEKAGWRAFPAAAPEKNRARGILQGALRGLYGLPMFAGLAIACGPWALVYGWAACLSKGLTYAVVRWVPKPAKYGAMAAEMIDGCIIGAAVYASILSGGVSI